MKVAAYCRVSTDYEDQANSFVNQKYFYLTTSTACIIITVERNEFSAGRELILKAPTSFLFLLSNCSTSNSNKSRLNQKKRTQPASSPSHFSYIYLLFSPLILAITAVPTQSKTAGTISDMPIAADAP